MDRQTIAMFLALAVAAVLLGYFVYGLFSIIQPSHTIHIKLEPDGTNTTFNCVGNQPTWGAWDCTGGSVTCSNNICTQTMYYHFDAVDIGGVDFISSANTFFTFVKDGVRGSPVFFKDYIFAIGKSNYRVLEAWASTCPDASSIIYKSPGAEDITVPLGCETDLITLYMEGENIDQQFESSGYYSKLVISYYTGAQAECPYDCCEGITQYIDKPCLPDEMCQSNACTCKNVYAPVCGVNNMTFDNACKARVAGISVQYEGECKECVSDYDCEAGQQCFNNACVIKAREDWWPLIVIGVSLAVIVAVVVLFIRKR